VCYRAMRIKINNQVVVESTTGDIDLDFTWNTVGYGAGDQTVRVEIASTNDPNWTTPTFQEAVYTLVQPSLAAPALASPGNGELLPPGTDVTLAWNSVSGATEYMVEIWGGQFGGEHAAPCGWTASTSCHIGSLAPGNVLWRVRARDSSSEGPWSTEWNFTPQ